MGEIGISIGQFYYGIKWWEVKAIVRGYNRRHRDLWSAQRWQTYNIMCSFVGGKAMTAEGIYSPKDLLPLPWDEEGKQVSILSDDEIKEMQAEMKAFDAIIKKKQ